MSVEKLSNEQRMIVLRMHAEGLDSGEISRHCKDEMGIEISRAGILATCKAKKNEPYVKAFRESYLTKVKSVPIANKRIRLDDIERQREKINRLLEKQPTESKKDKELYLCLVRELRQLSVTAREEMEKKPHIFQNVLIDMEDVSDESLHRRRQELITKAGRTLGRGAAGINSDSDGIGPKSQGEPD